MTARTRSASEALSECREAVRRYEDAVTPEEQQEWLWSLCGAFTRLDTYLTGGAQLPEPWKIAARLDAHRASPANDQEADRG
jgi:hypothetical protein